MKEKINILLLEDNPGDVLLIKEALRESSYKNADFYEAQSFADCLKYTGENITLILADICLNDCEGMDTVRNVRANFPDSSLIVLTGIDDEKLALESLREGAQNYLNKNEIASPYLDKAILYSLERHHIIQRLKSTERELNESKHFLEKAQEIAHVGSWVANINSGVVEWSDETQRIYGFEPGEFDNRDDTFFSLVHPEDSSLIQNEIAKSVREKKTFDFTHRIIRKNKEVRWVHAQAEPLFDKEGIFQKLIGSIQDITELKVTENKLQKSVDELELVSTQQQAILNTLPATIALLDKNGVIVQVNERWIKFGLENQISNLFEHIGSNYITISQEAFGMDKEYGKSTARGIEEILKGSQDFFSIEYPCDSPKLKRWFKADIRGLNSKGERGAVVMHIDISDRKQKEEEMELLLNNTEESFILLDKELNIVSFNHQFRNLYKKYLFETIEKGLNILEFVRNDKMEKAQRWYKRILSGESLHSEFSVAHVTEGIRTFDLKYIPAKDKKGKIIGVFLSAIDITDKKLAEEQKEFEKRDKEALINTTNDMIWSVSKDYKLIAANSAFLGSVEMLTGKAAKIGDDVMETGIFAPSPEKRVLFKTLYGRALSGELFKYELRNVNAISGKEQWAEISFNPVYKDKLITGIACYSRDITERKQDEARIKQSETRLKEAQQIAKVGSWEYDFVQNTSYWSDEMYQILGLEKEEIQPSTEKFLTFLHPEDVLRIKEIIEHSANTMLSTSYSYKFYRKDGALRYGYSERKFDIDKNRKIVRTFGIVQDVTEQRLAEEKITRSESKLNLAQAIGHVGSWELEKQSNTIFLSREACHILGLSSTQNKMPQDVWVEFIYPEDMERLTQKFNECRNNLTEVFIEHRLVLRDGTVKYVHSEIKSTVDNAGNYSGMDGTIQDVTEKHKAAQLIIKSEARLAEAQKLAKVGNWEKDLLNSKIIWSAETFRIFEINAETYPENHPDILDFVHPEDLQRVSLAFKNSIQKESINFLEHRIVTPEGKLKYVEERWQLVQDKKGDFIRMTGTCQDITERKGAEKKIYELNEELELKVIQRTNQLEAANKELESFSYSVSHDLRAPLRSISGFSEVLLQSYSNQLDDQAKHYMKTIVDNTAKMGKLIDHLLTFSRLGKKMVSKRLLNMNELVQAVATELQSLNTTKHYQLITRTLLPAYGDSELIHQVLFNLIGNAIKYSSKGENPIVKIDSYAEKGKVIYSIKDNGVGFDMQYYDKLFAVFQRLHSIREFEGTGVGLSIAQRIIAKHEGQIWAESKVNEGATFYFSLPNK